MAHGLFEVKSHKLLINGVQVRVFEFRDAATAQAAGSTISNNGYTIGTRAIDWAEPPNFWLKDRMIVLYEGRDRTLIDQLSRVLGEPLASAKNE